MEITMTTDNQLSGGSGRGWGKGGVGGGVADMSSGE